MYFEIINEIIDIEVIAVGGGISDIMRLRRQFDFWGHLTNFRLGHEAQERAGFLSAWAQARRPWDLRFLPSQE